MTTRSLSRCLCRCCCHCWCLSWWAGQEGLWKWGEAASACRNRGTACAQREPETFKVSPGHERRAKKLRNALASLLQTCWIALLLWKTAFLRQLQWGPGALRYRWCEVPKAYWCIWALPLLLPAGHSLEENLAHQPFCGLVLRAVVSSLTSQACSDFCKEGHIPPLLHFILARAVSAVSSVTGPGVLGGFDPTWHIPQSSAWNGHSFHTNLVRNHHV